MTIPPVSTSTAMASFYLLLSPGTAAFHQPKSSHVNSALLEEYSGLSRSTMALPRLVALHLAARRLGACQHIEHGVQHLRNRLKHR